MRMLQMIDTLSVGGAERIAVNLANALSDRIEFSGIVATRQGGALEAEVHPKVPFWCLHKRSTFDLKALFALRRLCLTHRINWVHAHGTSYFQAFLLKLILPQINIIWHEHAGARAQENAAQNRILRFCIRFFKGIVVVNRPLETWFKTELNYTRVLYLPNFIDLTSTQTPHTQLQGKPGQRILYLANLRSPKNHLLLVEAALKLRQKHPDWSYHLVGNDGQDAYSKALKSAIEQNHLGNTVYIYGLCQDIHPIIEQATIAVISSSSEGLPVSLLEYGRHKKPVVATAVGEIPQIVRHGISGFAVAVDDQELFFNALDQLMSDAALREKFGNKLFEIIEANHAENAVIAKYLEWIQEIQ